MDRPDPVGIEWYTKRWREHSESMDSIRVLHVDDDRDFGALVAAMLERRDDLFEVVTEANAGDAIERLETVSQSIDCIVSDYDMPGASGIDFLETVRESHPDLPFILFTGKGSEEVASDAIAAGATDYLQKKVGNERYELLANRIENAVEQYRSRRERDRVYQALETATQGIGIIDADGSYVYVNEAYSDLYGRTPADLVGSHWEVLYPDDEAERFREQIIPTLQSEGAWTGRATGLHWDGTTFPEELSLSTIESGGHVCVVQDLTDRVQRERELERQERRYRAVFEDPNLLIGLLDPDGTLREVNRTALEYVDRDAEAFVGRPFWETPWWVSSSVTKAQVREWIERAAAGEYVSYEADHEVATGETIHVEGTLRPVTSAEGTVDSLIVSARDVTDRVDRERRLERQADRFDDLASVISHDLQTPIEAARGRLKLALEMDDIEHVPKAVEALDRLDALRRDVVEVLRSGEVVNETVDFGLEGIVRDAVSGVEGVERDNLTIEGALRIEGDPGAVTRLFENLLSNTVEHAGDGVAVRVGPLEDGFYYEDDGPGIESDRREVVFEPGVSSKQETGGMGLASVQQIVDAHGWEIQIVDGMQLGGVRFEVRW